MFSCELSWLSARTKSETPRGGNQSAQAFTQVRALGCRASGCMALGCRASGCRALGCGALGCRASVCRALAALLRIRGVSVRLPRV